MITFNCFDTETSGLDPADHRILEIALIRYDMSGKELDRYIARINPERSIDAKAQAVHGISFSMLERCPVFADVVADIKAQLEKGSFVVGHNLQFDIGFLVSEFTRASVVVPKLPGADTMLARWATYNGKSPNLGELCFSLGIPYDPSKAHAAEYDVLVTAQCFLEGVRRGVFKIPEGVAP